MREIDADGFAIRPNKTRLKRELAELREMVLELMQLGDSERSELELSETFVRELKIAARTRPSSGRNRQIKYLAKLLQSDGYEQVQLWLRSRNSRHSEQNRRFHMLEQWRQRMLEQGDAALQAFLREYPQTDRQQIRQMIRSAQREQAQGKPVGAGKKLFRLLREISAERENSATL